MASKKPFDPIEQLAAQAGHPKQKRELPQGQVNTLTKTYTSNWNTNYKGKSTDPIEQLAKQYKGKTVDRQLADEQYQSQFREYMYRAQGLQDSIRRGNDEPGEYFNPSDVMQKLRAQRAYLQAGMDSQMQRGKLTEEQYQAYLQATKDADEGYNLFASGAIAAPPGKPKKYYSTPQPFASSLPKVLNPTLTAVGSAQERAAYQRYVKALRGEFPGDPLAPADFIPSQMNQRIQRDVARHVQRDYGQPLTADNVDKVSTGRLEREKEALEHQIQQLQPVVDQAVTPTRSVDNQVHNDFFEFGSMRDETIQQFQAEYGEDLSGYSSQEQMQRAYAIMAQGKKQQLDDRKNQKMLDYYRHQLKSVEREQQYRDIQNQYTQYATEGDRHQQADPAIQDETYRFVNDPAYREDMRKELQGTAAGMIYGSLYERGLGSLTDKQRGIYNYLYASQGKEAADKYLADMRPILMRQRAQKEEADDIAKAKGGVWGAIGASIASVPLQLSGSIETGIAAAANLMGAEIDPHSSIYANQRTANAYRQGVQESLADADGVLGLKVLWDKNTNVTQLLYSTAMSLADNMTAVALGGAFAAGGATSRAAKWITSSIMASEAGSGKYADMIQQGYDPNEALISSLATAAVEAATEKWSLDTILKKPKKLGRHILKSAGAEASEEVASSLLQQALGSMGMAGMNELKDLQYALMAQGYSADEAGRLAAVQFVQGLITAATAGALSGGVMGGVYGAHNIRKGLHANGEVNEAKIKQQGQQTAQQVNPAMPVQAAQSEPQVQGNNQPASEAEPAVRDGDVGETFKERIDAVDEENATAQKEQYQIRTLPNGTQYVEESRQVLKGNDPKAWRSQLTDHLKNSLLQGKDLIVYDTQGSPMVIGKDTVDKSRAWGTTRRADGKTVPMTPDEQHRKSQAFAHIDELAEVSNPPYASAPDTKNHTFSPDGFDYRKAIWKDASGFYEVTFSVGKDGNAHEIYNIGKMKKTPSLANAQVGVGAVSPSQGGVTSSIAQASTNNNVKSGQNTLSDTATKAYRALTGIATSMPQGSNAKAAASGMTAQAPSLSGLGVLAEALYADTSLAPREKTLIVDSFAQGIADHLQHLGDGSTARDAGYAIAETLLNPAAQMTQAQRDALLASPHALQVMESVARDMAATKNVTTSKKEGKAKTGGKVDTTAIANETLDKNQKASIGVMKQLSQATGVNFVLFSSKTDSQGRYIGENGSYDPKTHTIRIDIHAGRNNVQDVGRFALLRTASHELTHFIQHEDAEAYQQLQDFLAEEFDQRGKSMAELIRAKLDDNAAAIERYRAQGYTEEQLEGRRLSQEDAVAEVVADASEMMLQNSQAIARLAMQNENLFHRIKNFLMKLFRNIRDAFDGVHASSREAVILGQYSQELQQMWDTALEAAAGNFKAHQGAESSGEINQTEKSLRENPENHEGFSGAEGDVQYSERDREFPLAQNNNIQEDEGFYTSLAQYDGAPSGGRVLVANIPAGSIYEKVGLKAGPLFFDHSKLGRALRRHADHLTKHEIAQIPQMLSNPIAITEPIDSRVKNTFNVFGDLFSKAGNPIMVGLVVSVREGDSPNTLFVNNVIRTVHERLAPENMITPERTLYISDDKQKIQEWGRRLGKYFVPFADPSLSGFIRSISQDYLDSNGKSGQNEQFSDRVDLKYSMEDAMTSLAEDVANGAHDSLLLSGDNKAELRAYGTATQKLAALQEKLQDQHNTMADDKATRDEKIAARNRANMYQEQIAKLQERTQRTMENPELKAEAESRMEMAVRLLGKMTKADLQQEVVSLRERVNQLRRSYTARATMDTRAELKKAQARLAFLESKHAQQLLDQKAEMQQRIKREKTMNKQRIERNKLRKNVRQSVKKLNDLMVHETDYKHVPEAFKPAVEQLLSLFANSTLEMFDETGKIALGIRAGDLLELKAMYERLNDNDHFDMGQLAGLYESDVAEDMAMLADLLSFRKEIGSTFATQAERLEAETEVLKMVKEIFDHFHHIIRNENKIFIEGKAANFAELREETLTELQSKDDFVPKLNEDARETKDFFTLGNTLPVYFFKHLQGVFQRMNNAIRHAASKAGLRLNEAREAITEIKKKFHYTDWAQVKGDVFQFTSEEGRKLEFTREQALWVYAVHKRETTNTWQQARHLEDGGFVYEKDVKMHNAKGKDASDYTSKAKVSKLSAADIDTITGWLTAEQKAYADAMVGYMSQDMAALGNEASMQLYGIEKYKETYYFPYSSAEITRSQKSDAGAAKIPNDNRLKNLSFTKRTQKHANNALVMRDFSSLVGQHVVGMINYATLTVPIENMKRLMNQKFATDGGDIRNSTITALFQQKWGEGRKQYLETYLKDLNGGVVRDFREGVPAKMLSRFKKNAVVGSVSVALQQPSAIARATVVLDAKYLPQGKPTTAEWEEAMQYAGVAVMKEMSRYDVGVGATAAEWILKSEESRVRDLFKSPGKILDSEYRDDVLGALPAYMDRIVWTQLWGAVKAEQRALNPDMDHASETFMHKVAERYQDVIDYTQVYDSTLSRSQNMRSSSAAVQGVTAFMAEPTVTANMLADAFMHASDKDYQGRVNPARAVGAFLLTALLNSILKSLVTMGRKDDDDRTLTEAYLGSLVGNLGDALNPLNMLPIIRDVNSLFQGWKIQRPEYAMIESIKSAADRFARGKISFYRFTEDVGGNLAGLFGLPLRNVMRDIRTLNNLATKVADEIKNPPKSNDYAMGLALLQGFLGADSPTAKSVSADMYNALLKKDMNAYNEARSYAVDRMGMDDKKIATNMRAQIKLGLYAGELTEKQAEDMLVQYGGMEDRNGAYFKVQEWMTIRNAGEDAEEVSYSRYDKLLTAIDEGKSPKAEVQELLAHGVKKESVASAITAKFKPVYIDLYNKDWKASVDLKAQIVNAYVLLGYDRQKKADDVARWLKEK